ncbi:MAG: ParA family protein [Proteobacteria bacterium]|nr:ParA family protein [Pseudomonadota bacterium]MCH8057238.1 ParA family protein [Pseudomonadota bacterium]
MTARIIAVANQKGGVGKTTTCVNLAAAFAGMNYPVALLDLDPQGNATIGCGINPRKLMVSACEVLLGERSLQDTFLQPEGLKFDLLPSNGDLTAAEVILLQRDEREFALKRALEPVLAQYAWIFIDCPPSLSILTLNALTAADSVLIPMQCEYYALEGLTSLLNTIEQIRSSVNPNLEIEGLLRTMYDGRNNLATAVSDQLIENFGDRVYRTLVPRNIRVAEAPSYGLPVLLYDPRSKGAVAHLTLAGEMLRRYEKKEVI